MRQVRLAPTCLEQLVSAALADRHLGLEAVLRIIKLPTVHYRSDFGQMTNMKYLYGGLVWMLSIHKIVMFVAVCCLSFAAVCCLT